MRNCLKSLVVSVMWCYIYARNWPEPSRNWQRLAESHWAHIQFLRQWDWPLIRCTKAIVLVCYSFHPCHPFAGHAGLFAGHDTHGTHIGHLSLKSSKVRSLLALSVTMRRSIFGLLWFLESGHSTQTISNPVGISWHLTCTAVRCVLIVSCRQRIWQETCLCTQIGAPSGWFLTIFGSICLEKWLNYVELVCEELSEIVGCFSYVMLYMCKKLAWAFAQLAAFDRKPLDAYPVLDWPLIRCTGHRPSCWYRQSLPLGRDRMSNLRI